MIAWLRDMIAAATSQIPSGHVPAPEDDALEVGEDVDEQPVVVVGDGDRNRSGLAIQVSGVRNPRGARHRAPWGLLLHTTGGGVTARARKTGRSPAAVAVDVYVASQNGSNGYLWGGPAYVIDLDGTIYQLAPDDAYTHHAGSPDRARYLSGSWERAAKPAMLAAWRKRWPNTQGPAHLYPSRSPNADYIGVEMIPIGDGYAPARTDGIRFTVAQHEAAADLARDCAYRHGWPIGWHRGPRLLGHEDVAPLQRQDRGGGWDPGWLRERPYIDFEAIRAAI